MKKVPILFTKPQKTWLLAEKEKTGLSMNEIMRRILDNHIKGEEKENGK